MSTIKTWLRPNPWLVPYVSECCGRSCATSNLSVLPSSTIFPSHLPQGNLKSFQWCLNIKYPSFLIKNPTTLYCPEMKNLFLTGKAKYTSDKSISNKLILSSLIYLLKLIHFFIKYTAVTFVLCYSLNLSPVGLCACFVYSWVGGG